MEKAKKLEIINEIIERAETSQYKDDLIITKCKDDTKSFIRNFQLDKSLLNRIESIRFYSVYDSDTLSERITWNYGKKEFVNFLISIHSEIELYDENEITLSKTIKTDKIFIVHGHNEAMKLAVKDVINSLGLTPIILHEQPNKGRTIIEKFERLSEDVGCAIVHLSAYDE
jgi:predicted nucleotide-binding protein